MSNYTETKLNKFIEDLDEQVKSILPIKNPVDSVIEEAINMTYDQIKNIAIEECSILSYKLSQYAAYIQTVENRYKNIRRWAENNIMLLVGKHGAQYGDKWMKFDEKKFAVIGDNEHAKSLYDIWLKYGALELELHEISNRIKFVSQTLGDIKYVRQYK